MAILTILIPVSLFLGGMGLVAFFWALKKGQFDDPHGDAIASSPRIMTSAPSPDAAAQAPPFFCLKISSGGAGGRQPPVTTPPPA